MASGGIKLITYPGCEISLRLPSTPGLAGALSSPDWSAFYALTLRGLTLWVVTFFKSSPEDMFSLILE